VVSLPVDSLNALNMISYYIHNPLPYTDFFNSGRRLQVGVLTNPHSGGNKKGGRAIHDVLVKSPDTVHLEACEPESISGALSKFAQHGIDLIIINGGDGTIQATLTSLGNNDFFDRPPLLALLRSGTTSMLSRDIGIPGTPAVALQSILEWASCPNTDFSVLARPVLRIQRFEQPPLFGMFFGAGLICQGIKLFHSKDNPMGWRGQLMPTITMIRMLLSILIKGREQDAPLASGIGIDGRAPVASEVQLLLASTLERLFLGMRPYWGEENGPIHFTAIKNGPRHLLSVLFSLFRSQKSRHAAPANGYFSHNVNQLQLDMEGDFTLDGELYEIGEGEIAIAPAGPVLFLYRQS
jgi:diacylglycerol kinase (ATP)